MSARSVVIVEHERGIIRPTDGDLLLSKPEAGAGQGAGRDEQALWLTASGPLGSGWLDGAGSRLPPLLTRGRGRAEQVRAYHAHRRDNEQPQDREEGEPDEGESERVHRVMCPRGGRGRCWLFGQSYPCWVSIDAVSAEQQGRPPKCYLCAVIQRHPPDRLSVNEGAIGGAEVHEDHLSVLDPQLGMVPRDPRVDQAQVAVGPPAEHGHRCVQLVGALGVAVRPWLGPGNQQPRSAAEGSRRHGQVAGGPADLTAFDRGAADNSGADPESTRGQVRDALEAHPHRPNEGVALLPRMLTGEGSQLDAEVVRVHLEALEVGVSQFHHEIVRHQGPALRHDRGTVIHLSLHRAGHLNRLQLGFERSREGTLHHALEPALEALKNSHPGTSFPYPHPMVSAAGGTSKTC